MSHPPIPEAEFTPPWHQYFVKLKDYVSAFFESTSERLDALETAQAATDEQLNQADEEDFPIGCVAFLSFTEAKVLTAGEKIIVSGSELTTPILNSGGGSAIYRTMVGPVVGIGQWKLIGPPTSDGNRPLNTYFLFKRIS